MRSGSLRHRIIIQQRGSGVDSWGQPSAAWSEVAKVWADIWHPSGSEAIKADAPSSSVKASIRIRARAGIDAGMRVVHGTEVYDIEAVLPGQTKEHIDLACVRTS